MEILIYRKTGSKYIIIFIEQLISINLNPQNIYLVTNYNCHYFLNTFAIYHRYR